MAMSYWASKMATAARVALALAVLTILAVGSAEAGEASFIAVSPLSGPPGTTVEVTAGSWLPIADVAISAGYTDDIHFGDPVVFGDVIATTRSDEDGKWTAQVELGTDLPVPERPGFIQFRAVSDNLPEYYEGYNTATFALIVDGQRPNGAGGMHVSVSRAPGADTRLVFLSYRRVGSQAGFINRIGIPPLSLPAEVTFRLLPDGDYEVAAEGSLGRLPVGPGVTDVVADACGDPGCEGLDRHYRVQVVSIRNGEVADVHVAFGNAEALPNGGHGPTQPGGWRSSSLLAIAGLAAAGSLLAALGALLSKANIVLK